MKKQTNKKNHHKQQLKMALKLGKKSTSKQQ